jgi:ankyrin repeat protein
VLGVPWARAPCAQVEGQGLLLKHGADPNAGEGGPVETPLLTAARVGCWEITDVLLQAGADPDGRAGLPNRAYVPLYTAVEHGHAQVVDYLLGAHANPNVRSGIGSSGELLKPGEGPTPLMAAAQRGDCKMLKRLLDSGADRTLVDERGRRAIDYFDVYMTEVGKIRAMLTR